METAFTARNPDTGEGGESARTQTPCADDYSKEEGLVVALGI